MNTHLAISPSGIQTRWASFENPKGQKSGGGIENFGADFYNWLKTIGEVTESGDTKVFKDGRGETRTGDYQPGAYQAK